MRSAFGLAGFGVLLALAPAAAQSPTVSAADLIKDTGRYLNQQIVFGSAYCYAVKRGYECRTDAPLRISIEKMPDGAARTTIDSECGKLDSNELTPGCKFSLQMVPTESTTMEGDYIRDGRRVTGRITVLMAKVISATKE